MQSHIMQLSMPKKQSPNAIETTARKLRYNAMVKTCRREQIKDVFVAHHQDDQHESILLRMSKFGLRSLGILGVNVMPTSRTIFPQQTP